MALTAVSQQDACVFLGVQQLVPLGSCPLPWFCVRVAQHSCLSSGKQPYPCSPGQAFPTRCTLFPGHTKHLATSQLCCAAGSEDLGWCSQDAAAAQTTPDPGEARVTQQRGRSAPHAQHTLARIPAGTVWHLRDYRSTVEPEVA